MNKVTKYLSLALISGLVTGCFSAAPIRPVENDNVAAVYGNIALPNGYITRVTLYKLGEVYAPPFKSPPNSHTYTNGNFFFENLEPGKYFLVGFMSGQNAYYFNYRGIETEKFISEIAVDIRPGTVTYLGSYKVTGIDKNFFATDTFDIQTTGTPDQKTILRQLAKAAAGSGWDQRFLEALK